MNLCSKCHKQNLLNQPESYFFGKTIKQRRRKKRLQKRDEHKLFSQMNKLDKYFVK